MKLRVDIIITEGNEDIFQDEEIKTVPFLINVNEITAAYPTVDKEYINIFFGDWMTVRYSEDLWKELQISLA